MGATYHTLGLVVKWCGYQPAIRKNMSQSLLSKYKLHYEYLEDDADLMRFVKQRIKAREKKRAKRRQERMFKKNDR